MKNLNKQKTKVKKLIIISFLLFAGGYGFGQKKMKITFNVTDSLGMPFKHSMGWVYIEIELEEEKTKHGFKIGYSDVLFCNDKKQPIGKTVKIDRKIFSNNPVTIKIYSIPGYYLENVQNNVMLSDGNIFNIELQRNWGNKDMKNALDSVKSVEHEVIESK
jgi:hypothetical protein